MVARRRVLVRWACRDRAMRLSASVVPAGQGVMWSRSQLPAAVEVRGSREPWSLARTVRERWALGR